MKIPQRRSLVLETVDAIKEMLEADSKITSMPGERTLASRLQVGRDTLRAALLELEEQGWISASAQGKRRKILKREKEKAQDKRSYRIGFLSPRALEKLPAAMLLELDHVREMLAAQGISIELHSPSVFNSISPQKRLSDLVATMQCDAWVLYQTPERIQQWFRDSGIPSVVRGQVYSNVALPCLDFDWRAMGFHAGTQMIRNGHHSIGLIIPDTNLPGLIAARQGVESAIERSEEDVILHIIVEQGTAEAVAQSLQNICHATRPPTAMIATRSRQVLTLMSWLASYKMNIPHNMSVISLADDNLFESVVPKISHYNLTPAGMARNMVRMLRGILEDKKVPPKLMIPDFDAGGSVMKFSKM